MLSRFFLTDAQLFEGLLTGLFFLFVFSVILKDFPNSSADIAFISWTFSWFLRRMSVNMYEKLDDSNILKTYLKKSTHM